MSEMADQTLDKVKYIKLVNRRAIPHAENFYGYLITRNEKTEAIN